MIFGRLASAGEAGEEPSLVNPSAVLGRALAGGSFPRPKFGLLTAHV